MMLEETGTVIDVQHGKLLVETIARSSCSRCSSGSCSTSVIAKLFGLKRNRLVLENTLGASTGDRVVIGIPDAVLVKASLWAYLVPLLAMGFATWLALVMGAGDGLQALSALLGLVAGFLGVRRLSGSASRHNRFAPSLLRIERQGVASVGLTELLDF